MEPSPTPMELEALGPCPLCAGPVSLLDWRPTAPWIGVEGCACGGFFVEARLVARLAVMTLRSLEELAARVRVLRLIGREAWVTTDDGTAGGPLTVQIEAREAGLVAPPRPMDPWTV
jgi:hypothetical protein